MAVFRDMSRWTISDVAFLQMIVKVCMWGENTRYSVSTEPWWLRGLIEAMFTQASLVSGR
jgi:hypothetical protein